MIQSRTALLEAGKSKDPESVQLAQFREAKGKAKGDKNVATMDVISSPKGKKAAPSVKTPIQAPETPCVLPMKSKMPSENPMSFAAVPQTPGSSFQSTASGEMGATILGLHSIAMDLGNRMEGVNESQNAIAILRARFGGQHRTSLPTVAEHDENTDLTPAKKRVTFQNDPVITTPLTLLPRESIVRRALLQAASAGSSSSDEMSNEASVVSLDEVLKLKQRVNAMIQARKQEITSNFESLIPSPLGGSPPQADKRGDEVIEALTLYSDRLLNLLCAQMAHVETMKTAELELQARDWSVVKHKEDAMTAYSDEAKSQLEQERANTRALQLRVKELESELMDFRIGYESTQPTLQTERDNALAQAQANAAKVANAMSEMHAANAQASAAEQEILRLRAEQELMQLQVDQLQNSLASKNMDYRTLQSSHSALEEKAKDLAGQIHTLNLRLSSMQGEMEKKGSLLDACKADLKAAEHAQEAAQSENRRLAQELESTAAQSSGEVKTLVRQLAEAHAKISQLTSENVQLQRSSQDIRQQMAESKNQARGESQHGAELQSRLDQMQDELLALTAVHATAEHEMNTLLQQLAAERSEKARLQAACQDISATAASMAENEKVSQFKQKELQAEVAKLRSEVTNSLALVEESRGIAAAAEDRLRLAEGASEQVAQWKISVHDLETQLRMAKNREASINAQLHESEVQRQNLQSLLNETSSTVQALRDAQAKALAACQLESEKRLQALKQGHQLELATLQRQRAESKSELERAEARIGTLSNEISHLQEQLSRMTRSHEAEIKKQSADMKEQLQGLEGRTRTATPRRRPYDEAYPELERNYERLEAELKAARTQEANLKAQLAALEIKVCGLTASLDLQTSQTMDAEARVNEFIQRAAAKPTTRDFGVQSDGAVVSAQEKEALEDSVRCLQRRISSLERDLADRDAERSRGRSVAAELETDRDSLLRSQQTLRSQLSEERESRSTMEYNLNKQMSLLRNELAEAGTQKDLADSKFQRLQRELTASEERAQQRATLMQKSQNELSSLKRQVQQMETLVADHQSRYQQVSSALELAQQSNEAYEQQHTELQSRLAAVAEIASKASAAQKDIARLQRLLAEQELQCRMKDEQLKKSEFCISEMRSKGSNIEEQRQLLDAALSAARKDNAELQQQLMQALLVGKAVHEVRSVDQYSSKVTQPNPDDTIADDSHDQSHVHDNEQKLLQDAGRASSEAVGSGETIEVPSSKNRVIKKMFVHPAGKIELQYGTETPCKPKEEIAGSQPEGELVAQAARDLSRRLLAAQSRGASKPCLPPPTKRAQRPTMEEIVASNDGLDRVTSNWSHSNRGEVSNLHSLLHSLETEIQEDITKGSRADPQLVEYARVLRKMVAPEGAAPSNKNPTTERARAARQLSIPTDPSRRSQSQRPSASPGDPMPAPPVLSQPLTHFPAEGTGKHVDWVVHPMRQGQPAVPRLSRSSTPLIIRDSGDWSPIPPASADTSERARSRSRYASN